MDGGKTEDEGDIFAPTFLLRHFCSVISEALFSTPTGVLAKSH